MDMCPALADLPATTAVDAIGCHAVSNRSRQADEVYAESHAANEEGIDILHGEMTVQVL